MHILFLTDNFPPEVNAPASRTFEHCREWVKAGHSVTVITCAPNFPKGKVYPGYKNKLWQTETVAGIQVIRVWTYITANEGFVKRILDYISYMIAAIFASPLVSKPDIVVATSPLLFTAMAGYVVGVLKRIPFVFELRDIWPESIKAVGALKEGSFVLRFFEAIELFLYRKATKIISVTHSFKKILIERGIDGEKIDVITNGVDLERFKPQKKALSLLEQYALQDKFVVGYIGTHGMAHALETLLETAKKLKNQNINDVRMILLGYGANKQSLIDQAQNMELDNVIFIDSVSKDEVSRYWSLLDLSIIHLKKTPLFETVIPSKLFEGMAMGIPVLHGVAGESADIVNREGCGVLFEPENAASLFAVLIKLKDEHKLYQELKLNALKNAQNYRRSELALKMLSILTGLESKPSINT